VKQRVPRWRSVRLSSRVVDSLALVFGIHEVFYDDI
jgi:hypothetical protein